MNIHSILVVMALLFTVPHGLFAAALPPDLTVNDGGCSSITLYETRHAASLERHRVALKKAQKP